MQVKGTVISVENGVTISKRAGGSYQGSRLTYRDDTGKINEQAFHENSFKFAPALKASLQSLKPNDVVIIEKEKPEGSQFWKVTAIIKQAGGGSMTSAPAQASPKSTYETPEERAKKQVYIVRQSSITAALGYLELSKTKVASPADVIGVAKVFEDYVFDNKPVAEEFKGDKGEVF